MNKLYPFLQEIREQKVIAVLLALLMLQIAGYSQAQNSVFTTGIVNPEKLPKLDYLISEENLAEAFSDRHEFITEEYSEDNLESGSYSTFIFRDRKINDARNLFIRYLENDLLLNQGKSHGSIEIELVYYNHKFNFTPGSVLNVLTLGVGYVLGIPSARKQTEVEIEISIRDRNQEIVGTWFGKGKNNVYEGLYYRKLNERESSLLAMKEALESVNAQIMSERERIEQALMK